MRIELIDQLSKLPSLDLPEAHTLAPFLGHDAPLVFAAYEHERCCGLLPLKARVEKRLGVRSVRLSRASPLHGHADDASARAMLERLVADRRFGLLELQGEPAHSPLTRAAERLHGFRFSLHRTNASAHAQLQLAKDLDAWFHGLGGWAAPLVRRTRSLMAAGELELLASHDPRAGRELLALYLELEARSHKLDAGTGISADPQRTALHVQLAESGATIFQFLLLDGLPVAATLSLQVGTRLVQLESVCDMSFEDTAPDEVLFMLEVRGAITRGAGSLELSSELVPRHARLGAATTKTATLQLYRRFSAHHLDAVLRRWFGASEPPAPRPGPMRSELGKQLRARTHATEALDRLDQQGADVERLWGDTLRAALPFQVEPPEHERVRRAV